MDHNIKEYSFCSDCHMSYYIDLILPDWLWCDVIKYSTGSSKEIKLCPSCIGKYIHLYALQKVKFGAFRLVDITGMDFNNKTKREIETELFVDTYTEINGHPPTYDIIRKQFKLKSNSGAHFRTRKFRHKLKQHPKF